MCVHVCVSEMGLLKMSRYQINGWQIAALYARRNAHSYLLHTKPGHTQWESCGIFYLGGVICFQIIQDALRCPPPHFLSLSFLPLSLHLSKLAFLWYHKTRQLLLLFFLFSLSALFWLSLLFYSICIHTSLVEPNSSLTRVLSRLLSMSLSFAFTINIVPLKHFLHFSTTNARKSKSPLQAIKWCNEWKWEGWIGDEAKGVKDECRTISLRLLWKKEMREKWRGQRKKKFRMDLKRAVRSDGEKETLRAVFRSSFNNWIIISLETWPRTGKEGARQSRAEDDTLLPPCDFMVSPLERLSERERMCVRTCSSECAWFTTAACLSLTDMGPCLWWGEKKGLLDVRKEPISLCHKNYTHT